jgi:hypothetical protein
VVAVVVVLAGLVQHQLWEVQVDQVQLSLDTQAIPKAQVALSPVQVATHIIHLQRLVLLH